MMLVANMALQFQNWLLMGNGYDHHDHQAPIGIDTYNLSEFKTVCICKHHFCLCIRAPSGANKF